MLAATLITVTTAQAAPSGGEVQAGSASITQNGSLTLIEQQSSRAVIDWRSFDVGVDEAVRFAQPGSDSATLNRVNSDQISVIMGRVDANGQLYLLNPNGVVIGEGANIDVGALVATTANIGNSDFMAGNLDFNQPGVASGAVVNLGTITAAEGGLVALVAPQVENSGTITARLGRVALAAGERFTIDLYGDQLINFAVDEQQLAQLFDAEGQPITARVDQSGLVEVAGGEALFMSAASGKGVLDQLINISGVVRADTVEQHGGRIVLLGRGGSVTVAGELSARGTQSGQSGGAIDVRGEHVFIAAESELDVSGSAGGGVMHLGGDYQGGDGYRATTTTVSEGSRLRADGTDRGDGGEVVVWADGVTDFSGSISARGGSESGNGGEVEVSGKQQLSFRGQVDAGAENGEAGTLLLDPTNFTVGLEEAAVINYVLRSGTSTTLQADIDIDVDAAIDGRGLYAGGGITLNAGNDINLNNYIVTNNGAVNLNASAGTVNVASGQGVYSGTAPIAVTTGAGLINAPFITANTLTLTSSGGSVTIDEAISASNGTVVLVAADDVIFNAAVVNLSNGSSLSATADDDIVVNEQIDGSGGISGGQVVLTAGGDVTINEHVITDDGAITVAAAGSVVQAADGLDSYGAPLTKQLRSGSGTISVSSGASLSPGSLVTSGTLLLESTGGSVTIDVPIYETVGDTAVTAAGDITINQPVANTTTGNDLVMMAGGSIVVNDKVGPWDRTTDSFIGRDAISGGTITLLSGNDITINDHIASYDAALGLYAGTTLALADNCATPPCTITLPDALQVNAGSGTLTIASYNDLNNGPAPAGVNDDILTGYFTTGLLNLVSTNGSVTVAQTIPDTTGEVMISAGDAVQVDQRIYTDSGDISIYAGAGGIAQNQTIDPEADILLNTYAISDIDAREGNIWLQAVGDITPSVVRTGGNLTILSTAGEISGGQIQESRSGILGYDEFDDPIISKFGYPDEVDLAGYNGITDFDTMHSDNIDALSANGSVTNLVVSNPSHLMVIAKDDIVMGGQVGNGEFYAGRDTDLGGMVLVGDVIAMAGRDVTIGTTASLVEFPDTSVTAVVDISVQADSLTLSAGYDPYATLDGVTVAGVAVPSWSPSWTPSAVSDVLVENMIWIEGTGGMSVTAAHDIILPDTHVSYSLADADATIDPLQLTQNFTLAAG
ncbi:hypothetical protein BOW53_08970, partial [Solemya pervernicosa gill symbiont]